MLRANHRSDNEDIGLRRLRYACVVKYAVLSGDRRIAAHLSDLTYPAIHLPAPDFASPIALWRLRGVRTVYLVRRSGPGSGSFFTSVKRHLRMIGFKGKITVIRVKKKTGKGAAA